MIWQNLAHVVNPKTELPMFLIKPVQKICNDGRMVLHQMMATLCLDSDGDSDGFVCKLSRSDGDTPCLHLPLTSGARRTVSGGPGGRVGWRVPEVWASGGRDEISLDACFHFGAPVCGPWLHRNEAGGGASGLISWVDPRGTAARELLFISHGLGMDLIKRASKETYPHYDELQQGYQVAKRIADQANETIRKVDNRNTVKALEARVDDWKGHQLHNFGELLLEDIFIVTKAEVDREYHVFLFEKIILCCKEVVAMDPRKAGTIGKVSKSGSLLKKQQSLGPGGMPSPALGAGAKRKTPLLLKGRIFLNNVTKTVAGKPSHALQVWWRGDDDLEFFTLRCRSEEQLTKWETNINQLIKENANRRASDRAARQQHDRALSTSSALSSMAIRL
ncbi:rho guanine nucleotide exchange factor scd1 [Rhizoctonia solani AG-1 IA]|uniref:Rho guanine nucleotide exchange factor scd1 n=1 Tax=Thanatephorus cucumeris (strain AG1-IA) TaxID=983506 RepID=L8X1U6_THACA|nr:rho guanine nucleotide exchange factor scd1 [Rhizoctonia solani AG-1 IA]